MRCKISDQRSYVCKIGQAGQDRSKRNDRSGNKEIIGLAHRRSLPYP
jgi:hypothetical protein